MTTRPPDPGAYDQDELESSILRGRLDIDLLRARAWCEDVQAMCMYADWLLHRALEPDEDGGETEEGLVEEARQWLRRAVETGSAQAAGMLQDVRLGAGARPGRDADRRRWLMRAAARGDTRSAAVLARMSR